MYASSAVRRILLCLLAASAAVAVPSQAQEGHWLRADTKEDMTGPTQLAPFPAIKFAGKSDDQGMTFEQRYTSMGKDHVERGHFSWTLAGGSVKYLLPGKKLVVQGKVSNLASEGAVTASVVLGGFGFSKGGVAVPAGAVQALTGEAEVPKPSFDKSGNAFLTLKFGLSGGNETKFIERTLVYKWTPGPPPADPGAGAPSETAGRPPAGGTSVPSGDGFTGDWVIASIDSKLSIRADGDSYEVRTVDKGVVTIKGRGFVVGGRLVFSFYRADRPADGGFAIYQLADGRLDARHINFDCSDRWQGTYVRP